MKTVVKTIKSLVLLGLLGALFFALFLFKWVSDLPIPDFSNFGERKIIESTRIYDRNGENLLYDIHANIKRITVAYEDIPRHLKNATVAIEDDQFYQHKGISLTSIVRACLSRFGYGGIKQGGSTITQQLIKKTFLTPEKTIERKIKEAILAIKIEKILSKEQILTFYLNEVSYGGSNYGVGAAVESFFGKNVKDLTLAESAYLAALLQAPTYYSPYGNHREELEERKNLVLKRMHELGFIEEEEFSAANEEKVKFLSQSEKGIKAPHFVMYIKSYLERKYGKDVVEEDGLKITTTLDLKMQEDAEKLVTEYAKENEKKFNAKNAGLIAIDPKTGQILTMVGSRDYFDSKNEGNFNITMAKRQPGSAFKPFVYATAFRRGYTPDTVVFDLETEFNASCNPDGTPKPGVKQKDCYKPSNYDGINRGPITLRNALAQSINIPSVKVLYLAGLPDSLKTAQDLGITTLNNNPWRYGLTLVLGGGEVTLLEMTGAYSVFANSGIKNPITGILKIEDRNGNILEEFSPDAETVMEEKIAIQMNDILSDNKARAPAFGETSFLYFPEREVAVKTGTTNDYRDAWVIGYTPSLAVGVWAGNNDNTPMEKKVAGFIAAPLWNAFFKKAFENIPKETFKKPDEIYEAALKPVLKGNWRGGKVYLTDKISGKLATEFTPLELVEEKNLTQIHSILYWLRKENPLGEPPVNPNEDPQFILWEEPIRKWVLKQGITEENEDSLPKEEDDIHKPEYAPEIKILSPETNKVFKHNEKITVKIEPTSRYPLEQIDFYLNELYLGSLKPPLYEFFFKPESFGFSGKDGTIKMVVYDNVRNKKEYFVPLQFEEPKTSLE